MTPMKAMSLTADQIIQLVDALETALPTLRSAVGNSEPSDNCWNIYATDSEQLKQEKRDQIAKYTRAKDCLRKAEQALYQVKGVRS